MKSHCAAACVLVAVLQLAIVVDAAKARKSVNDAQVTLIGAGKVSAAGDVNGDGIEDFLVAKGDLQIEPSEGIVYVVFGGPDLPGAHLSIVDDLQRGFVIRGPDREAYASQAIGAGDVNGDGKDDILVGAPRADVFESGAEDVDDNVHVDAGVAYVVFGKSTWDDVELADFDHGVQGLQGYRITGPFTHALAGRTVSPAGDVNGDSLDDVLVGAPFAGAAYVVYGKVDPSPVSLAVIHAIGATPFGYAIYTRTPDVDGNFAVGGGGDINGDGIADLIVAMTKVHRAGVVHVVFGSRLGTWIDVDQLGDRGFKISGRRPYCPKGEPRCFSYLFLLKVGIQPDMNGDGMDEVIIGEPQEEGRAYVIFGRKETSPLSLSKVGDNGTTIHGEKGIGLGSSLSSAGDVDGDGIEDLLIGAPYFDSFPRRLRVYHEGEGATYVVLGNPTASRIDVRAANSGWIIVGDDRGPRSCGTYSFCPGDQAGASVAGGDFDGDGRTDFLIGAEWVGWPYAGESNQGAAYIFPSPMLPAKDRSRG